jgi:hypothetical protein
MNKRIGQGLSRVVGAVLMVACATVTGVVGCGSDPGSAPASKADAFQDGVNILSSNPAVGVSIAYKASGRVVFLETKVGQLKEEPYRTAFPDEPMNEMDARVLDQEGRVFGYVMGGDKVIDKSWGKDFAFTTSHPIMSAAEGAQRTADFLLAREGAKAFAAQAGPELADHVFHLSHMTQRVPSEDTHLLQSAASAEAKLAAGTTPADREFGGNGCGYNLQEGELFYKSFVLIANHSATIGWNYNGCYGDWDQYWVTCNHGTCADMSNMSYSCSSYSLGWTVWENQALLDFFSAQWCEGVDQWGNCINGDGLELNGACTNSGYGIDIADITVYGSGDANHVCNDDSANELQSIRNAGYVGGAWSGGSGGWNGNFSCQHWTHWYGPLDSDGSYPNCP